MTNGREPIYVMQQILTLLPHMNRRPPKPRRAGDRRVGAFTHNMKRALGILQKKGSMNQRSLAKELKIKAQSVSVIVRNLEKEGLLEKEDDPSNKSSNLLVLTDEGIRHALNFEKEIEDHSASFFRGLSQDELDSLSFILEKLIFTNNTNYK
ncbi:MAG: MarR family winged helix-turn-helix transcriptional regulator [Sphaerochaetaceae bacterium]